MMNENFFGKYSVFCVFGSVVVCVVVPLIAQVLQHQSMECMILSAIFLTLTAAHLKKGGSDSHHSKLLISRDYDRKKIANHSTNSNKKQKSSNSQNGNHSNHNKQHHQQHHEEDYIQQYEHLKILEMEKRNEEKRIKKEKKREERLKKKEEESRKMKEEEERRAAKEKRKKKKENIVHDNNHRNINNSYHQTITNTYEKYCCNDTVRYSSRNTRKSKTSSQENYPNNKQQQGYITKRQNIPRFNNARKNNGTLSSSFDGNYVRSNSDSLSINCSSSLSASCSSLSSIGSSGSCSPPPPPTSPGGAGSVWKTPCNYSDSDSTKSLSPHKYDSNGAILRQQELRKSWTLSGKITEEPTSTYHSQQQRVFKSYTNVRPIRNKFPAYNFNSSSLFCSSAEESCTKDMNGEDLNKGGEYSLFGSHQFGKSFIKSPII